MPVRVHVPEMLRRYTAGAAEVVVEGTSVGAVIGELCARHPELRARIVGPDGGVFPFLVVFLAGRELPRATALDTAVADGAVLEIVGAAEGG